MSILRLKSMAGLAIIFLLMHAAGYGQTLRVTPDSAFITVDSSLYLTATIHDTFGDTNVTYWPSTTWHTNDSAGSLIDSLGWYKPALIGTFKVWANYAGFSDTSLIIVSSAAAVAVPVISPNGGTFSDSAFVTISCATAGATIRYTTNGSEPTGFSAVYPGWLILRNTTTVKAKAFKSGLTESPVASAVFTRSAPVNQRPVVYGGPDTTIIDYDNSGSEMVTLSADSSYDPDGTIIRYRWYSGYTFLDSNAHFSRDLNIGIHLISLIVTDNSGDTASDMVTITVAVPAVVATPVISPNGGTFLDSAMVTVSCATAGAEIRYTTNGSTPTDSSALYSQILHIKSTTTVKAKAFKSGLTGSSVASATFTKNAPANQHPVANAGFDQTITDSDNNGTELVYFIGDSSYDPDGSIVKYWWRDGATFLDSNKHFSRNLTVGVHNVYLKVTDNYGDTAVDGVTITVQAPAPAVVAPVISPNGGDFSDLMIVTLSCATAGAAIRYTTNGSDPTISAALYAGSFTLTGTATVKARAFKSGMTESPAASAVFTKIAPVNPPQAQKIVVPDSGVYISPENGVMLNVLSMQGTDTITFALQPDAYPPDLAGLANPLKRNFTISAGERIDSIRTIVTFYYQQDEFDALGLRSETDLFAVRYHGEGWTAYPSVVDTFANTVSCTTSGFSTWAIDGICRGIDCSSCTVAFTSEPLSMVQVGCTYSYPVSVTGGQVRALPAAPAGMTFSGDTVYWTPGIEDTGSHLVEIWANGICRGWSQRYVLTVENKSVDILPRFFPGLEGSYNRITRNPNSNLEIQLTLPTSQRVAFAIYNTQGTGLLRKTDHKEFTAGKHVFHWPEQLAPGVYLLKVTGETFAENRKLLILK